MSIDVWKLWPRSRDGVYLQSAAYDFSDFRGQPIPDTWRVPPIEIHREKAKKRDFVPWSLSAPAVSKRARDALEPLVGSAVQFVPLIFIGKTEYFAMNVVKLSDCLDTSRSQIQYSKSDPMRIVDVLRYKFHQDGIPEAPVFKLSSFPSSVFVLRQFVDAVIELGLTGAGFADPSIHPAECFMKNRPVNVVEGLPT